MRAAIATMLWTARQGPVPMPDTKLKTQWRRRMSRTSSFVVWTLVALLGAFAFGTIALAHGERISALWIVICAVCVYLIAYRFYSRFIASTVLQLDGLRMTPAVRHN